MALPFSKAPEAGNVRPHRLVWPRTPPFHGGDRGSNPLGDAKFAGEFRHSHYRKIVLILLQVEASAASGIPGFRPLAPWSRHSTM